MRLVLPTGRVPGEIKRSSDLRGGRCKWTLTFAQKRSWVGRWSWAEKVGRLLLRVVQVVRQQRCNGHCLSDCPAQQLKEQLHSAQVAGQWRGDTALTLPLFWRRSTAAPVFFGRFPRSSLSLSRPLPTLSPSLIGHLASVDVKQHESNLLAGVLRTVWLWTVWLAWLVPAPHPPYRRKKGSCLCVL